MTPLPKKKHTRSRSAIRRGGQAAGKKSIHSLYSKAKGIKVKLSKSS